MGMSSIQNFPHVLSIAASAALCSLALKTKNTVFHWQSSAVNQHSEQILPAVSELLSRAGIAKPDLLAVDIGPGAFTSVRVACGVAQGLALGWDCPVVAVESLTALAQQAWAINPQSQSVACIIDARMNECYVAHFVISSTGLQQTQAPSLVGYEQIRNLQVDTVIGNAKAVIANWFELADRVYDALPSAQGVLDHVLNSSHIAPMLPEQLQPMYVRNQVALTSAQRAEGKVM
jgi:tRNA threonylcarbamoyladenosine biosynthesis protein TsaB